MSFRIQKNRHRNRGHAIRHQLLIVAFLVAACVCLRRVFTVQLKFSMGLDMDMVTLEAMVALPYSVSTTSRVIAVNTTSLETTQHLLHVVPSSAPPKREQPFVQVEESDKIQRDGYNWAPYVIEEYRLLFFTIQKTGCTVWKQLFRRMLGYADWATAPTFPPKKAGLIQLKDYTLSEATRMINDPTWTRAIFVRDPKVRYGLLVELAVSLQSLTQSSSSPLKERFLSAYLQKVVQSDYAKQKCCLHRRKGTKCFQNLKSFEGFFNITRRCHDSHWTGQADRLDSRYYPLLDFVGHTETAASDARRLLERIGAWEKYGRSGWGLYGNESIFESTSNVKHKTSKNSQESHARLAAYYTPELEVMVESRLADDYAIPRYNLPSQKIVFLKNEATLTAPL
jgi:hypothetical protein